MSRLPDAYGMNRSTPLNRTPMKRKNVKRAKKRRARDFGDKADWIRKHPCCVCHHPGPVDPHHYPSRGAGGTARDLVPLCTTTPADGREGCHQKFHRMGPETFQREYGVDLREKAARYEEWWKASDDYHIEF